MNTLDRKQKALIFIVIVASVLFLLYKSGYILGGHASTDTNKAQAQAHTRCQDGGRLSYLESDVIDQNNESISGIVEEIEHRRQFLSGGDMKPDEFLPPKTLENTTEHDVLDDSCENYVNSRIGMDTNAYLPRKSNSRTIYQSIAGDVPINSEPIVASRVISTYTPPVEGFIQQGNRKKVLDVALAQPY